MGAPGDRLIVVGLGNPGERYELTRHNAGAKVVAELALRSAASLKRHRSGCLAADVSLGTRRAVIARPTTFMNDSGRAVGALLRWYGGAPEDLLVVHDEIDIPFGLVRVKKGGGTAGHNGLESVVSHVGTKDFARVRIGVSRPRGRREAADWVLERFSKAEKEDLPIIVGRAADAVERIAEAGLEIAMNEFNAPPG